MCRSRNHSGLVLQVILSDMLLPGQLQSTCTPSTIKTLKHDIINNLDILSYPKMTSSPNFVDDPRFNRSFTYTPPTLIPSNYPPRTYTITYADYGYHDPSSPTQDNENVILWFPPMLCSRLEGIVRDSAAQRYKVRVIAMDRPGMGGSDMADGHERIARVRGELFIARSRRDISKTSCKRT